MKAYNTKRFLFNFLLFYLIFCSQLLSQNTIELRTIGQNYGVADLDEFYLSYSPDISDTFLLVHCEYPTSYTTGKVIDRDNAHGINEFDKWVWGNFGCDTINNSWLAVSGSVWYANMPEINTCYIKFRYSRYITEPLEIPFDIYVNDVYQYTYQPDTTGDWDIFTESEWIQINLPIWYSIAGHVTDIEGNLLKNVNLNFSNGISSVTTNDTGYYEQMVYHGWSGTITPAKTNFSFTPVLRTYNQVSQSFYDQNFVGTEIKAVWSITDFGCDFGGINWFTLERDGSPVCGSENCPSLPAMPPGGCWLDLIRAIQYNDGGISWVVAANGSLFLSHSKDNQAYGDTWIYSNSPATIYPYIQYDMGHIWINNNSVENTSSPILLNQGWNHLEFTSYNQTQDATFILNYDFTGNGFMLSSKVTLALKVFLEGPFINGEMLSSLNSNNVIPLSQPFNTYPWYYNGEETVAVIPNSDVVDWILVELRETAGDVTTAVSATVIGRQAAFLLKNGDIVGLDGISPIYFFISPSQNLFVVVHHRNHLSVISSQYLTMNDQREFFYNFTDSENKAYGGSLAQKELQPGIWGMFAGDANSDGIISLIDKNIDWKFQAGLKGYYSADFNLNCQVNNVDKNDSWKLNFSKISIVP